MIFDGSLCPLGSYNIISNGVVVSTGVVIIISGVTTTSQLLSTEVNK